GGWTFNIASGQLRSAPKTIWVEIPQTATPQQWMLEARSEWAADPAQDVIRAEPVIIPATDPGRYRGKLYMGNPGEGTAADRVVGVPIEAIVTPTHVAVIEPTRVVLPDGHVVLPRDASKSVLLGWLTSGTARYDVALTLADVEYETASGFLRLGV